MKYVFTQYAGESRFLARNHCISVQLGYEDYLSDNGYSYTINLFVHDPYYRWRYLTITDMPDKYTKLPYVMGDEIYFVLGRDLDKFKETALKEDENNFKFVEKSEFYDWILYNGSPRLKEIADNYFKNTKCSYVQFKNLNVGDIFKLTNGDFLYIKIAPTINGCCRWDAVVLTGDNKGCIITFTPETNVEIVRNAVLTDHDKGDLSEAYKNQCKLNFMTYGGVPMDVIKYTKADCESTWRLYKEMGNTIKKVIFNDPATIVIWGDGSKTAVKAQKGEKYDKEKGLALCYMKKILGNKSNFNNVFREWIKPEVTGFYDKKHPELGIQDIPPKNSAKLPSNQARIKSSELKIIHKYMRDNVLTYTYIAKNSGLSINTVKRALTGCPVLKTTLLKICGYFEFPIGFTYYEED